MAPRPARPHDVPGAHFEARKAEEMEGTDFVHENIQ